MLRNVTLSADDAVIERARARAQRRATTLNAAFREWIERYATEDETEAGYAALMERLGSVQAGRHFDREELNER